MLTTTIFFVHCHVKLEKKIARASFINVLEAFGRQKLLILLALSTADYH